MPWDDLEEALSEELGQTKLEWRDLWHHTRAVMHIARGKAPEAYRCTRCGGPLPDHAIRTRRLCTSCTLHPTPIGSPPVVVHCIICGKEMKTKHGRKFCSLKCKRKKETMSKKNTKPDAPKSLAKAKVHKITPVAAIEGASINVETSLQLLADVLTEAPTIENVTLVQLAVKAWSKRLEDAEKISKTLLIEHLKEGGKQVTEKGSLSMNVQGYLVEARPHRTGLDAKKLEALLRAKELEVDTYMDKEIKYIVNETRLQAGIADGAFTQDELDTCKYELSYALQPIKKAKEE